TAGGGDAVGLDGARHTTDRAASRVHGAHGAGRAHRGRARVGDAVAGRRHAHLPGQALDALAVVAGALAVLRVADLAGRARDVVAAVGHALAADAHLAAAARGAVTRALAVVAGLVGGARV